KPSPGPAATSPESAERPPPPNGRPARTETGRRAEVEEAGERRRWWHERIPRHRHGRQPRPRRRLPPQRSGPALPLARTKGPPMSAPMLTAKGLRKHYGTAVALGGVDFAVAGGESVAVTGPSGSGKSTLLHCLAGVLRPDEGEVRLFDERIDALSERER